VPKFFFKQTGDTRVIEGATSYFNSIKNFAEWDVPHIGFCDYFKSKMNLVNSSLQQSIMEAFAPGTPVCSLAKSALNNSCTWIEALFSFMNKKYAELWLAHFGEASAWSLTMRPSARIIDDVAAPRTGVVGSLGAGEKTSCPKVFWSVI
jgi:hypothetical protein